MSRRHAVPARACAAAACLLAACSQIATVSQMATAGSQVVSAANMPPPAAGPALSASAVAAAASGALMTNPAAEDELKPDRSCSRPLEKFDIMDKALDYGGTTAQLRLQRLISSDFKYSDLTPDDKKLLHFIAETTIWVPLDVETYLARAYEKTAGKAPALKPIQKAAVEEDRERLKLFRDQVLGLPGDIRFEVRNDLSDGAYAELGALIVTSPTFLTLMEENPQARDLVLSHELSHVYKRHRLKQLQSRMVSSASGFDLAKKLMNSSPSQASTNPIYMVTFAATTGPALWDFYQQADLAFTKDQEYEADACAAIWMKRAQVDPCAAWRGFVKIAPKDGAYAETHPTTEEREENYRRLNGAACAVAAPTKTSAEPSHPASAPRAPAVKRPPAAASAASGAHH
jgi:hypothetical protein